VDGIQYTIDSDVDLTGLTVSTGSPYTFSVSDSDAFFADNQDSKCAGEDTILPVSYGTGTTLGGSVHAYKLVNGAAATEYFLADDLGDVFRNVHRGYFFDSSDAPIGRITVGDTDVLEQQSTAWIFANTSLALAVTYDTPYTGSSSPSTPAVGRYWFDTVNDTWKKYNGSSWDAANATLIGVAITDTSNTVGARTFDAFVPAFDQTIPNLRRATQSTVETEEFRFRSTVNGIANRGVSSKYGWDMASDLDTGITEAASTEYYFYLTEDHGRIISDIAPINRTKEGSGWMHPYHLWRCYGSSFNNAASNLETMVNMNDDLVKKRLQQSDLITFSSTSATYVLVTNSNVRIRTSGGPVLLSLQQPAGNTLSYLYLGRASGTTTASMLGYIRLQHSRNAGSLSTNTIYSTIFGTQHSTVEQPTNEIYYSLSQVSYIHNVEAGDQEYYMQSRTNDAQFTLNTQNAHLTAIEI